MERRQNSSSLLERDCWRISQSPFIQLTEEEISYLLTREILPWFEVVEVPKGMPYVEADPEDDKFIWCAIEGKAEL